jgi:Rrf2 family protein
MKLSTRTRYGLRAMVEIAAADPHKLISVREIAANQDLSLKYMEQIMSALKSAGFVRAIRGPSGGYALARSPETIQMSEIFQALEGSPCLVDCVEEPEICAMAETCPARRVWLDLHNAVKAVLENTTLQDLIEEHGGSKKSIASVFPV